MFTSVELRQKAQGVMEAMRAVLDGAGEGLTDEQRAQWDGLKAQHDKLMSQVAIAEAQEALEATATRSAGTVVGAQGGIGGIVEGRKAPAVVLPESVREQRAAAHYLRTGDATELRAYNNTDMNIGTVADGGYAVPTGMYNGIIARRDETLLAPRLGVRQIPGQGLTVNVPIDDEADVLFTSLAEANQMAQDAPALNQKAFTLVKYAKYISLSWELLRDEDANLLAFVNDWIGRGIAATENNVMLTEARANGTAGLTLDAAAAVGATEIPELVGKLMPEYQDGAAWVLNPATVAYLQGLMGTSNYYFAPAPVSYAGKPTLWGFPVEQSSYASAIAASAKSLIFGNWNFMGRRLRPDSAVVLVRLRVRRAAGGSDPVRDAPERLSVM